jgi:uncharacterized protein YutD
VVLAPSVSTRYADSLGTYQYCVGEWSNELVYLTKFLEQHLDLVQINSTSEASLTSYLVEMYSYLIH